MPEADFALSRAMLFWLPSTTSPIIRVADSHVEVNTTYAYARQSQRLSDIVVPLSESKELVLTMARAT